MQKADHSSLMEPVYPYAASRFELPTNWHVDIAKPESVEPLAEPQAAVRAALADPLYSPPLSELVRPGDQVCIALAPPTIPCPERILLPPLLGELEAIGVRDEDITLLYATGLHGRTDHEHKVARFGDGIVERYRIVDHDVSQVVHLGQWQNVPLTVNRAAMEADLLIATGVVAPHLYAGYSGGGETVSIGCAGDATIEALYTPRFLFKPQVRPGQIQGNPFQEIVQTVTHRTGLRFILNAVLNPQGEVMDVQAGDPFKVHQYLVFASSGLYDTIVPQIYDVVVAGLDPPHDASLYQAILGALFVGLSAHPTVRPGGVILLPARTPEAVGEISNARNFFSALQGARSPRTLLPKLWEQGCQPGEARAFQLARLLEQNHVIVVGSEFPALAEACHLQVASDMLEAADLTRWLLGDELDALIIPHALHALPVPPPSASFPDRDSRRDVFKDDLPIW